MDAQELFRSGQLSEAVAEQVRVVKAHPMDRDQRFMLFVLLCFQGDLERAERQLDALENPDDPRFDMRKLIYGNLLISEAQRRRVFRAGARPLVPAECPAHIELRLQALEQFRIGERSKAKDLLGEADRAAIGVSGTVDGAPFDAIRDYDDFLAGALEAYTGGRCLWVPFERIDRVEISAPRSPLDLLWAPARIRDRSGEEGQVHLPVLYEGSHEHPSEEVRLGRRTEWQDCGGNVAFRGVGQKVLLTASGEEEKEYGLLAVRVLELRS